MDHMVLLGTTWLRCSKCNWNSNTPHCSAAFYKKEVSRTIDWFHWRNEVQWLYVWWLNQVFLPMLPTCRWICVYALWRRAVNLPMLFCAIWANTKFWGRDVICVPYGQTLYILKDGQKVHPLGMFIYLPFILLNIFKCTWNVVVLNSTSSGMKGNFSTP